MGNAAPRMRRSINVMGGGGPLADVDLGGEEEQSLLSLEVSEPLFMLLLSWLVLSHRRSEQSRLAMRLWLSAVALQKQGIESTSETQY